MTATSDPVFVVGTGRCGSTLISRMVREHPEALSVSELFSFVSDLGMRIERALPTRPLTGFEFWAILAEPQPRQSILLRHGLQMAEVIYPWSQGRFTPGTGLPPILQGLVPHLDVEDPDALFDDIGRAMSVRPVAAIAEHYRAFFSFLMNRFDRRLWVERSGGSLRVVRRLIELFPEAKIVHVVRDGRDVALSMSRHIGFRMALVCGLQVDLLGVDPYESGDRSEEQDLDDDLAALLPENFSADAFRALDLDAALLGHYWSGEIVNGLDALGRLAPDRLLTLHYEKLLADPADSVKELGQFMTGDVCPDWVETAAAMVEPQAPRWPSLPARSRAELELACAPGVEALLGAATRAQR